MKTYSAAWKAALAAGSAVTHGAVKIMTTPPFLVWSGAGNLTIGADTFVGVGDAGLVMASGGQIGGTEDGITLQLSGVDPDVAGLVDYAALRNAQTEIWRLGCDPSAQVVLDAQVFDRGRLDKVTREDVLGGTATLKAAVETAARGLGKKTGRITSDADQRMINPNDGSSSRVTSAGDLTMAWGGKPPARAGAALPGGAPFGVNVGGVDVQVSV